MSGGDIATLFLSALSFLVAACALFLTWLRTRTKLVGQVDAAYFVPFVARSDDLPRTAVLLHLTLTNARTDPIYVRAYELSIDRGRGLERLERLRDVDSFPTFTVEGETLELAWDEALIDFPPRRAEHAAPLTGFVLFYVEGNTDGGDVRCYHVTAIDTLGARHEFSATPDTFLDEFELVRLLQSVERSASGAR